MSQPPRTIDVPDEQARSTFAAATEHAGVLYLAGVIATGFDGKLIGPGDPAAQARACLDRIEQVLAAAGAGLGDVLRATCFGTTPEALSAYIAERNRRLPTVVTNMRARARLTGFMDFTGFLRKSMAALSGR